MFDKDAKNKRLIWIEERLEFLYSDIKNKRDLKEQLDKKVKKIFLIVRWIFGSVYIVINLVTFWLIQKEGYLDKLSVLLNFNQAVFIVLLTVLYIKYETPKDFKLFFKIIHLKIQELVYKNHAELKNELNNLEKKIENLTKEKSEINSSLEVEKIIEDIELPKENEY